MTPDPALSIALLWSVAVVTPGPNFLAAARISASRDRAAGFAAVAGIGCGTAVWGLAACFGVQAMVAAAPHLFLVLKLAGAAYLMVVGARLVCRAPVEAPRSAPSRGSAFRTGLLTSLSNPKSAFFVAALFAAVLPPDPPLGEGLSAVAEMVAISLSWYACVVGLLTTRRAAAAYARSRRWVDRVAGSLFVGMGARLALWRPL